MYTKKIRKVIPPETIIRWLKAKNDKGLTQKDIAKAVGCGHATICNIFKDGMAQSKFIDRIETIINN